MKPVEFGPYTLLRRLGRGGMAEVFLARAATGSGFQKLLAIKCLLGQLNADQQLVSMLADEARLSVWLYHPGIVQVLDFGQIDGRYYIAMEYVDGSDLTALIRTRGNRRRGRPLPLPTALYVMLQVMDALDYAHRRRNERGEPAGIIHRDVSPHNVLISREGQVKLADFGLARASISIHTSHAGVIRGKFSYMPKEQAHGRQIDHRIDIFAAGATLYEALTGRKPYTATNLPQQLYQLEQPVPPPSQLIPDIPEEIDDLTMQALSPDPEGRYATAAEMADDLQHALGQLSTSNQEAQQLAALVRSVMPPAPPEVVRDLPGCSIHDELAHHAGSLIEEELAARRTLAPPAMQRRSGPGDAPGAPRRPRRKHPDRTPQVATDELETHLAATRDGHPADRYQHRLVQGTIESEDELEDELSAQDTIVDERAAPAVHDTLEDAKTVQRSPEEALAAFRRAVAAEASDSERPRAAPPREPVAAAPRDEAERPTHTLRRPPPRSRPLLLSLAAVALVGLGLAGGWLARDHLRHWRRGRRPAATPRADARPTVRATRVTPLAAGDAGADSAADLAPASAPTSTPAAAGSARRDAAPTEDGADARPDGAAAARGTADATAPRARRRRRRHQRRRRRRRPTARPTGTLSVTAGTTAQVLIDGRVAGTTPLAVRLPPGIYRVKVLERGSTTYSPTRWITVEAGKRAAAAF